MAYKRITRAIRGKCKNIRHIQDQDQDQDQALDMV